MANIGPRAAPGAVGLKHQQRFCLSQGMGSLALSTRPDWMGVLCPLCPLPLLLLPPSQGMTARAERAHCPVGGRSGCAEPQHLWDWSDRWSCSRGTARVSSRHMDTWCSGDTALPRGKGSLPMEHQHCALHCRLRPLPDTHYPFGSPGGRLVA